MKNKLTLAIVVATITLACFAGFVFATAPWNHTITGTIPDNGLGFQVYTDSACTQVWNPATSTTISTLPTSTTPFTETYYIKNLGNAAVTVTPSANIASAVSGGSANMLSSWSSPSLTLQPSATGSLTLTVTEITGTAGDFTIQVSLS